MATLENNQTKNIVLRDEVIEHFTSGHPNFVVFVGGKPEKLVPNHKVTIGSGGGCILDSELWTKTEE